MGGELLIRFMVGGLIVSSFAVLSDVLRPKSFAGIFGAAPSVAIASLGLTYLEGQAGSVPVLGRSMVLGSAALLVYCLVVTLLLRRRWNPVLAAGSAWLVWLAVAFGLWRGLVG